ncbi:L-lactate dehydrogenase (cytochrome) [Amorphus suaedae]
MSQGFVATKRVDQTVAKRLRRFLNLTDFQRYAKRKLPAPLYEYYSGAAENGTSYQANFDGFKGIELRPRVLVDVSKRTARTSLFGRDYRIPVGISPMGLSGLATYEGDLVLAKAAAAEDIPMVLSATSLMPLERVADEGGAKWFQAYLPGEPDRILAMLDRVERAGYETFVLTVDLPVPANRENNERAGFSIPLRPSLRLALDGLMHPHWTMNTFLRTNARGIAHFENMDAFRGPPILSRDLVRSIGARDQLNWKHVELIRARWKGSFVLKGIMNVGDAMRAQATGVDGIVISNHGGRQLDGATSPITVLPEIAAKVDDLVLMIDGGVRRGTDVLKCLALGADFVFVGRPFLFSAIAGIDGVRHAIQLLAREIDRDMAMLGAREVGEIGPWALGIEGN